MKAKKIGILVLGVVLMFGLTGCQKKYNVDYCGEKSFFKGARDSYPAGKKVRLVYNLIATDTSYYFYMDGEEINYSYSDREGMIIEFIMPEHDIKLWCKEINTMEWEPGE